MQGMSAEQYATHEIKEMHKSLKDGFSFKNSPILEELKEFLDSVSLAEGARKEQEVAESQQSVLNKAPLKLYIG